MMNEVEIFDFPRKAGIMLFLMFLSLRANLDLDWDPCLKPDFQQEFWDLDALGLFKYETDDVGGRSKERQHGERSLSSTNTLHSIMPPSATSSHSKQNIVKTPRSDFTIGLSHSTISDALMKRGLAETQADYFLKVLQRERKHYSDLTLNFLTVRFSILVIEGKSYAIGKIVFEAQNQAAVSGGCMINLCQQLTDLFEGVFLSLRGERHILPFRYAQKGLRLNSGFIILCHRKVCAATT